MAMTVIWTGMVVVSILCGLATETDRRWRLRPWRGGRGGGAVPVHGGVLCLWMGVMEVMRRSGLSDGLSRLLRPVLRRLYPEFARTGGDGHHLGQRVGQPAGAGQCGHSLGIQAARQMSRRTPGRASDALCMLVVCNTASIQLIPTTVASVRLAAGCAAPFDILPAVWLASVISVCAGIGAVKLFGRVWRG
ncbi:MAG: spore maturation protein A [Flavonifractor plautii]